MYFFSYKRIKMCFFSYERANVSVMSSERDAHVYLQTIEQYVNGVVCGQCKDSIGKQTITMKNYAAELIDSKYDCIRTSALSLTERLLSACEQNQNISAYDSDNRMLCREANSVVHMQTANNCSTGTDDGDASKWTTVGDCGVYFCDIFGSDDVIQVIRESTIFPFLFPVLFRKANARPCQGLLMYGPPGTGKSMIARATATEAKASFFNASCAELTSKWVGGSEKLVRGLFKEARSKPPSIIFFDEVDSIASSRDSDTSIADQRLTNQILVEIDRCHNENAAVFVMAATNIPWKIDPAIMRRFAKRVYIPPPNTLTRQRMFQEKMKARLQLTPAQLENIGVLSENLSGADIANICDDTILAPLRILYGATVFVVHKCDVQPRALVVAANSYTCPSMCSGEYTTHKGTCLAEMVKAFGEESIHLPPVTIDILIRGITACVPSIEKATLARYTSYECTLRHCM